MGTFGFSSMLIISTVYSQEELESTSKKLSVKQNRPADEIKIEYAKIRKYTLSNFDEILKKLSESETDGFSKPHREDVFRLAMQNRIDATIYEYESNQDANKALALLGGPSEYSTSIGKYYIFSKNKHFKVKPLEKYIGFCTTPLHQIFKRTVSFGYPIPIPNGWKQYNQYQPDSSDIDVKKAWLNEKKDSPLIQAIVKFNTERAKKLIQEGTELNAKEKESNRTALHLVLLQENSETINTLVPLLIEAGIDCNTQDNYGVTPLMLAAQHDLKMTKDLISCGADPQLKTKSKETALDYAKDAKMKEIVNYLMRTH